MERSAHAEPSADAAAFAANDAHATPPFSFKVLATDGAARRGRLVTRHGAVETPVFMPCGTYGTVKAMTPEALHAAGTRILLGNAFHLMARPGDAAVRRLAGCIDSCSGRAPSSRIPAVFRYSAWPRCAR